MPAMLAAAATAFSAAVTTVATAAGTFLTTLGVSASITGAITSGIMTLGGAQGLFAAANAWANVASVVAMVRKPKLEGAGPSPVDFKADPNAHIPFLLGRFGTGGNIVFAQVSGDKNNFLSYYTILSAAPDLPIQGIESFKANDQFVTFNAGGERDAIGHYNDRMWQVSTLGAQDQSYLRHTGTGNKFTPFDHGGNPPEWTANHRLRGFATTMWTMFTDTTKYANGTPKPLWVVNGIKVTDPRTGEKVFSKNPWCHAYQFLLGYWLTDSNGQPRRIGGVGLPAEAIDTAAYIDGANVADANGWEISGQIHTGMPKWNTLAAMLAAGGGVPVHRGHLISAMVSAPRVSVATIEEHHLLKQATVDAGALKRDRKNTLIPRFRSEQHRWTVVPGTPITNANYVEEDGEERATETTFDLVTKPVQVGQLTAYSLADGREGIVAVVTVGPEFYNVRAGMAITANIPKNGLVNRKMIVTRRRFDPKTFLLTFTLRSETDAKHAWALGQSTEPPETPALEGVDDSLVPPPNPGTWNVTTPTVNHPGGGRSPLLRISLDADMDGVIDDPNALSVIIDYRPVDEDDEPIGDWRSFEAPVALVIDIPVEPNVRYEVVIRYRYPRNQENPGTGTDPVIVVTPPVVADDTNNVNGQNVAVFAARVTSVESLAAASALAIADLEEVYGDTASAAASAAAAAASEAAAILSAAAADTSADYAATQAGLSASSATAAAGSASAAATSATQAGTYATDAGTAAAASTTARVAAEAARDNAATSASAAATSASSAAASETAAGSSASSAATSATNAATSAGAASTSATAASTSATTAAGHAATAGTAATNAANSATAAGGSASAAAGSASSAATSATNAGNSASAAAASQVAARSVAASLLPSTFDQDSLTWSYAWYFSPAQAADYPIPSGGGFSFVTVPSVGRVLQMEPASGGSPLQVSPVGVSALQSGRRYRVTAEMRVLSPGSGTPRFILYFIGLNASLEAVTTPGTFKYPSVGTWSSHTYELTTDDLLSLNATSAYVRPMVTCDPDQAGNAFQLRSLRIDDITESTAAGTSASAAATSASSAATSATAAGTSATAASGSATSAATSASQAGTFASQASTSAGNAASSASTAGTHASNAAASAATATTQASNASASAASASASAMIAATVNSGALTPNGGFDAYTTSPGFPDQWGSWIGIGAHFTRVPDGAGGYAVQIDSPADTYIGMQCQGVSVGTVRNGDWIVWTNEAEVTAGTWDGSGFYLAIRSSDGSFLESREIHCSTTPDDNGVSSATKAGRRVWTIFFQINGSPLTNYVHPYVLPHWIPAGIGSAQTMKVYRSFVRPATPAEIAAGTVLPTLQATVTQQAEVLADLEDNYELARFTLATVTSGGAAVLSLFSDNYGTVAGLSADQIYFGENTYFDNATDTMRTTTGSNIRVTAYGASFGTDGQLTEWEGPSSIAFSAMSRSNAYYYRANVAPYVGGSGIPGGQTIGTKDLVGTSGNLTAQTTVSSVQAGSYIDMVADFSPGEVDSNTLGSGEIIFEESNNGSSWTVMETVGGLNIGSTGEYIGPCWNASGSFATMRKQGTLNGTVYYRARWNGTGGAGICGSNYQMSGTVTVTPPLA